MAKRGVGKSENWNSDMFGNERAKPVRKPRRDESTAQRILVWKVTELRHKHPCLKWLYAIPNEAGASNLGGKLKAEGLKRGVFDMCLPYPRAQFHGMYLEMKLEGQPLSEDQIAFKKFVNENGYYTCVCATWEEAYCELDDYCSLPEFGISVAIPKL
jgi:hypothetical protein